MKQQNLQPWGNAADVMSAVNEIAALTEENRGIPKAQLEYYGILAVISDLEFKHLFLKLIEERCPAAHPQFVRYLHKLAENGKRVLTGVPFRDAPYDKPPRPPLRHLRRRDLHEDKERPEECLSTGTG